MSEASLAPYLFGACWPGTEQVPYPRANPADADRLPMDTWGTAQLPVGVRLEFVTDAPAIEIDYSCATDDLGYRGAGAGTSFNAWRGEVPVGAAPASLGRGTVRLALDGVAGSGEIVTITLPEGMRPTLHGLRAVGGTLSAPPARPRWIAYGDSITEGWVASSPAGAWPARAGRRYGLDVVNLGYAGSARGEIVSAEYIAALSGVDVISVAHGTNCWSRIPHTAGMVREGLRAFLRLLRRGHPAIPIVVASPVLRPDAETTSNVLGATLTDLRVVMEEVTEELIAAGDANLQLVRGGGLLTADQLPDGIHPGDAGHAVLAEAFGGAVSRAVSRR